jgi:DNA-binding HxlR family transcriptional regulator
VPARAGSLCLHAGITPTVSVTVTYELTDPGMSLHDVMRGIKAWAEANMDTVLANQGTYDAAG